MIRQKINGRYAGTVNADLSTADTATLAGILAGESTEWTTTSSGGTSASVAELNFIGFSVGKKGITPRTSRSVGVRIPHVKPTKTIADIKSLVVGAFDQDFTTAVKCEYCNLFGASSKGA